MTDIIKADENIFKDLSIPNSDDQLAKAQLALKICKTIQSKKMTQIQAASLLKISQPDVSDLMRGRLKKFSLDRLIHLLNLMDWDIDIVVKRKRQKNRLGITHVVAA